MCHRDMQNEVGCWMRAAHHALAVFVGRLADREAWHVQLMFFVFFPASILCFSVG